MKEQTFGVVISERGIQSAMFTQLTREQADKIVEKLRANYLPTHEGAIISVVEEGK